MWRGREELCPKYQLALCAYSWNAILSRVKRFYFLLFCVCLFVSFQLKKDHERPTILALALFFLGQKYFFMYELEHVFNSELQWTSSNLSNVFCSYLHRYKLSVTPLKWIQFSDNSSIETRSKYVLDGDQMVTVNCCYALV